MWELLSAAELDVDRVLAVQDDTWEATSAAGTERITWTYDTAGDFPGWSWTSYRADGGNGDGWSPVGSYEGTDDEATRELLVDAVRAVTGERRA